MASTKTTTQRGLGWEHQKQREKLLRAHVEGTLCWWCGEPMYLAQGLAADHSHARAHGGTKADRLLHGLCNKQRGDGSKDDLRPAVTGKPLEQAQADQAALGVRVMLWP